MACVPGARTAVKRLTGATPLHLQKVIALEPSGALLWWDFFFSFSVPGLLKPWFVYLLDGTLTGMVQTCTSMSALCRNGRWHSQAICWPSSLAPHTQAWNNMTLSWSESLNMLQSKAKVSVTIFMVDLWAQWNPLSSFSVSNLFHNIKIIIIRSPIAFISLLVSNYSLSFASALSNCSLKPPSSQDNSCHRNTR